MFKKHVTQYKSKAHPSVGTSQKKIRSWEEFTLETEEDVAQTYERPKSGDKRYFLWGKAPGDFKW